jgi:putative phosphoribosyl transferase
VTPAQPDSRWTGAVTALEDPPQTIVSARRFEDRHDAGRRLASLLERYRAEQPVIVGMPRGGVPVAAEVAAALDAPLDVAIVRKVGAPQNPEFAIGAVAEGGVRLLGDEAMRALGLTERGVRALFARAEQELASYVRRYRGSREPVPVAGRTVILVDDGLATGRSAAAALQSLRRRGAARLILAVPVAAAQSARALGELADEVVVVERPEDLWAVGYWYERFAPTSDAEVLQALAQPGVAVPAQGTHEPFRQEIAIDAGAGVRLGGELVVPERASVVVVFAHGSGSGRHSPRNRAVAGSLNEAGYATLLFDLLSEREALNRANVFDIPLLAARLLAASKWVLSHERSASLGLAYFGASTGAAAALTAAATQGERVSAVISRGGRPDLAENLPDVRAPTLLIVGGADREVLELNRAAQRGLRCRNELAIVPGAGHLFEEPGALEQVSALAVEWLLASCAPSSSAAGQGGDRGEAGSVR